MKEMLKILGEVRIITKEQIAERLNICSKSVYIYRNILLQRGHNIKCKNGRNGGYYLEN